MGKRKKTKIILPAILILFLSILTTESLFAYGGGGGGGGGDEKEEEAQSSIQSTGINVQSPELAAFKEAALFNQFSQGQDLMDNEFIRIGHERNPRDIALDRAEFLAWLSGRAEASGDNLWGGTPGTSNANERAPGDTGGSTQSVDVYTSRTPVSFDDIAAYFAWNAPLNIARTLGYGMLAGNNETVYRVNQQSQSGRAINNFITNINYTGRRAGYLPSHDGSSSENNSNSYNVVGGEYETPRAE